MSCKHTNFFDNLGKPQSNREYWMITEIFVYLHNGKDYCNCQTHRTTANIRLRYRFAQIIQKITSYIRKRCTK